MQPNRAKHHIYEDKEKKNEKEKRFEKECLKEEELYLLVYHTSMIVRPLPRVTYINDLCELNNSHYRNCLITCK